MTNLSALLQTACDVFQNEVHSGEEFIVRDLFRGFEWNRIPRGDRTKLGSMFLVYAQNNGDLIEILDKTPQNQQRYRKR